MLPAGGIGSGIVSASKKRKSPLLNNSSWQETYQILSEEHSQEEADIFIESFTHTIQDHGEIDSQSGEIVIEKADASTIIDKAYSKSLQTLDEKSVIKAHSSDNQELESDLESHFEMKERHERALSEGGKKEESKKSPRNNSLTVHSESSQSMRLDKTEVDGTDTTLGSRRSQLRTNIPAGLRFRNYTGVSVGGSLHNAARIYTTATAGEDVPSGDVEIKATFEAKGVTTSTVGSASAEFFVFARDESGYFEKDSLKDLGWTNDDDIRRTGSLDLDYGEEYDIDLELRNSASALVEYCYADYYSRGTDLDNRHVTLNGVPTIEPDG